MALWLGPEMMIRPTLLTMIGWNGAFELFSPQLNLILWFLHHSICKMKLDSHGKGETAKDILSKKPQ